MSTRALRRRYGYAKMSLQEKIDRVYAKLSPLWREMIAAGRGRELPSETAQKTDPLSIKVNALKRELEELQGMARRASLRRALR